MRTFLNAPILDINCTYQMFAHRSCVIPFTKKIQCFLILNKLIKDSELYDTSVVDDLGAK